MANQEHLDILKQGVKVWNRWREENPKIKPDLSKTNIRKAYLTNANLYKVDLSGANLSLAHLGNAILSRASLVRADISEANLMGATLHESDLTRANLSGAYLSNADLNCANFMDANLVLANLSMAYLGGSNLSGANLFGTNLVEANLYKADLKRANLTNTDLSVARLIETNFEGATLTNCRVYGISAWGVKLKDAVQTDLIVTPFGEPKITVDNLELAQFIYMLLYNEKIRDIIDIIGKKAVLILGRFTPERKVVLDALRAELRERGYLPILFDFDKPSSRNLTETVSTLAHLSRFVIADITDAKSIPQELQRIVPDLPSVPVQPLLLSKQYEYAMFKDFLDYPWVLKPYRYDNLAVLLAALEDKVISPAVAKVKEIEEIRKALEKSMVK
jgi:uncharacterized protein YjbI with pentapeptide repeats